jgi:hypothetical protein
VPVVSKSKPGIESGFLRGLGYGLLASSVFWVLLAILVLRA